MDTKSKAFLQLVKRAMRGEPGAIDQLCAVKVRSILYACTSLAGNKYDGEDMSQEVCLHLARDIVRLKNASSFQAWLYKIIQREYVNMVRKQSREREFAMEHLSQTLSELSQEFHPEEYLEDEERRQAIDAMIATLPPQNKLCLLMFYYEGMSYADIAKALDISKKEVDYLLQRSRRIMKKTLEKQEGSGKLLCQFSALVSAPVLGGYMRQEAAGISQAKIDAVVESTLANAHLPAGTTTTGGVFTMVKVVAITAAVAVGSATGYSIVRSQREAPPEAPQSIIYTQEIPSAAAAPLQSSSIQVINTLEDMIGSENVDLLNAMAKASPIAKEDFDRFVASTGILHEQEAWVEAQGNYYDLYCLDKQDKRLMLIVNREADGTLHGLTYRFTNISEEMPHSAELLHRYSEWRA